MLLRKVDPSWGDGKVIEFTINADYVPQNLTGKVKYEHKERYR